MLVVQCTATGPKRYENSFSVRRVVRVVIQLGIFQLLIMREEDSADLKKVCGHCRYSSSERESLGKHTTAFSAKDDSD
jgi:hypothetical protein